MNRLSQFIILTALTAGIAAQAQTTLRQQNFPTSLPTEEENIEWQRGIYREVLLTDSRNAGLYCPQRPAGQQTGLFTTMLRLAVKKAIPIYSYVIDGNEAFCSEGEEDIRDVLTNHHVFFVEEGDSILVDDSDVPAQEVMAYYVRESVCYDLANSAFRTRVDALCPVLMESDGLSEEPTRYPLFWVRYDDMEPFLKDIAVIPDYATGGTAVSMADYFTRNLYRGEIYKVANPFGHTLRQTVGSDSALAVARQRIEGELRTVRKTTFNAFHGQ